MPATSQSESRGYPSFVSTIIYLSVYYIVELATKKIFKYIYPKTFSQLQRDGKDTRYFGFIMGILIAALTAPVCVTAFATSDQSGPFDFSDMSTSGQICIASRAVIWISELNRLDYTMVFIAHHLSSLGFLVWHLQNHLPLQILYGFYASLATEVFSGIGYLLELHGLKATTSVWAYRTQITTIILVIVLRIPPIIYGASFFQYWPITGYLFWVNAACLLLYAWYMIRFLSIAMAKLKVINSKRLE